VNNQEKPIWWPKNPYPEDVFTMTVDDYIEMFPDPAQRTAISGCLGRIFWNIASDAIWEGFQNESLW
jgi:hypothetical protein